MTPEQLINIVGQGGVAVILFFLLQRVMDRLDKVTDKLIEIAQRQQVIIAQLEDSRRRDNSEV
jgi:hypothetical protein